MSTETDQQNVPRDPTWVRDGIAIAADGRVLVRMDGQTPGQLAPIHSFPAENFRKILASDWEKKQRIQELEHLVAQSQPHEWLKKVVAEIEANAAEADSARADASLGASLILLGQVQAYRDAAGAIRSKFGLSH
jgi:hypothetical protein